MKGNEQNQFVMVKKLVFSKKKKNNAALFFRLIRIEEVPEIYKKELGKQRKIDAVYYILFVTTV